MSSPLLSSQDTWLQFTFAEKATDWRSNNNIAESIFNQARPSLLAIHSALSLVLFNVCYLTLSHQQPRLIVDVVNTTAFY